MKHPIPCDNKPYKKGNGEWSTYIFAVWRLHQLRSTSKINPSVAKCQPSNWIFNRRQLLSLSASRGSNWTNCGSESQKYQVTFSSKSSELYAEVYFLRNGCVEMRLSSYSNRILKPQYSLSTYYRTPTIPPPLLTHPHSSRVMPRRRRVAARSDQNWAGTRAENSELSHINFKRNPESNHCNINYPTTTFSFSLLNFQPFF